MGSMLLLQGHRPAPRPLAPPRTVSIVPMKTPNITPMPLPITALSIVRTMQLFIKSSCSARARGGPSGRRWAEAEAASEARLPAPCCRYRVHGDSLRLFVRQWGPRASCISSTRAAGRACPPQGRPSHAGVHSGDRGRVVIQFRRPQNRSGCRAVGVALPPPARRRRQQRRQGRSADQRNSDPEVCPMEGHL